MPPATAHPLSRRGLLDLLDAERDLILARQAAAGGPAGPFGDADGVRWYLGLSYQWAVHHLRELAQQPAGRLLEVGALFGFVSGAASRLGWRVAATDSHPLPACSGLHLPERGVEQAIHNACGDPLPFPDQSFDAVLLPEVLEHIQYSPVPLFREIARVLRPGGQVLISTPNPAGLGKLFRLARGGNPLEPFLWAVLDDRTYTHNGRTYFVNWRESKLWTAREVAEVAATSGLQVSDHYYYGNTVSPGRSLSGRLAAGLKRAAFPLTRRLPVGGGSLFVRAGLPPTTPSR